MVDPSTTNPAPPAHATVPEPSVPGRRWDQEEGVRAGIIASVSTILFFGVAALLITRSPNWPRVRDQFFSVEDFRDAWPDVLGGFWVNVELFFQAMVLIPIVALLIAVMRSLRGPAFFPLRLLSVVYTDVFRGIPLILLIL
ncbi:MAG: amino acid ABC transporter permease, partial [Actinomycetota bacterium]